MADLKPCRKCGGANTRIEPKGQIWAGQKYSDPQWFELTHWCDGPIFTRMTITFKDHSKQVVISRWNQMLGE